jgi:hypothetical protein
MSPDKVLPMSPDSFVTYVPGRYMRQMTESRYRPFMGAAILETLEV